MSLIVINSLTDFDKITEYTNKVVFGDFFNQVLGSYIDFKNVTYLDLGHCFNQPIDGSDPSFKNIKHLIVHGSFQHPIVGFDHVTHLTLGHEFFRSIDDIETKNLTHLIFEDEYIHLLGRHLKLDNLVELRFHVHYYFPINHLKLPKLKLFYNAPCPSSNDRI